MGICTKVEWLLSNHKRLRYVIIMSTNVKFALIWTIFVIASFIHDFFPIPPSYFSNSQNVFNVMFVKKGWGWTSLLLTTYIISSLIKQNVNKAHTFIKHWSRIIVYTIAWYCLTSMFEYIEGLTGSCIGDPQLVDMKSCIRNHFVWNGFDISGHCFLLTFCILNINKELHHTINIKIHQDNCSYGENNVQDENNEYWLVGYNIDGWYLNFCYDLCTTCLLLLTFLWEVMLFFTCIYFHTLVQKLLGMGFGVMATYICHLYFQCNHPLTPSPVSLINAPKTKF